MKPSDWKNIGEFVGLIAIVSSLIFVGFQLRQDRDSADAESVQSLESSTADVNAMIAEHADVWLKGRNDEVLTATELIIMRRLVDTLYRRARYTSQMRRILGRPGNAQLRDVAIMLYENPGARRTWEDLTENEVTYFEQMASDGGEFRRSYRVEVLTELAKLDELQ
jgi:hypothetical protein